MLSWFRGTGVTVTNNNSASGQTNLPDYSPPLVISAHGILTYGKWQKDLPGVVGNKAAAVEAFDFGHYGVIKFLMPACNNRKVNEFYKWYYDTLKRHPDVQPERYDKRPCLVAHSFGTWIVGYAMLKYPDIKVDKLILFGCILPRDFDWITLFGRDQVGSVVNECGLKDPWPGWANRFVARSGTAGTQGFEWFGPAVQNVTYEFEHSDAAVRAHMENCWLPVLLRAPSPLALLHGHDIQDLATFEKTLNYTGTVIDKEVYGKLPHYNEVEIPRGLSSKWIRINPDIYTFLIDRESRDPAGYLNAMPLDDSVYEKVRKGELADNKISENDVVPFQENQTVRIYLMSIAIAEKHRRFGDGVFQQGYVQLLSGFVDKLIYYAKNRSIRVTHFLATAWTPEGRRMCESFGMHQVGLDPYGDGVYEVELAMLKKRDKKLLPALRRLLTVYAEK
jgi:pimeloyl-ACP methyl ester carboxylesterase